MKKITNEQLDCLIRSAINSSGPLPPDEKFSQIISVLLELRNFRAAPPVPVVVKAPEFKVHAQHPTMAAGMRDNDWKEAIKAAGGSVADE